MIIPIFPILSISQLQAVRVEYYRNKASFSTLISPQPAAANWRKLIVAPEEDIEAVESEADSIPPSHLARQLARAHAWLEPLEAGTYQNVLELAEELNVDTSYIGRILRLVNLAPDIQEAIINGMEPDSLSFKYDSG